MTFDPHRFRDPNPRLQRFKSLRYDPELAEIKHTLREINMRENPDVQKLVERARLGTDRGRLSSLRRLVEIIENYKLDHLKYNQDPYMPYANYQQISNNGQGVHICDQINTSIPLIIDPDIFLHNTVVLGRPQSGKSSAVFYWLNQL